ncbi:MAG TPA: hypothetical protein VJ201_07510 [Candidatus Babeliales bacterium]|nr:hypothetical protein [Candidatus Babeliales bacterium]
MISYIIRAYQEILKYPNACYKDGEIIGCPPYSLAYYHELGHDHYAKQLGYLNMIRDWSLVASLFFIIFSFTFTAKISIMIFVLLHFFEELYAWQYGFKQYDR